MKLRGFEAKVRFCAYVYSEFNTEKSRNISGKIIQYAKEFRITELSIIPFSFSKEIIESLVEGIILSSYSFGGKLLMSLAKFTD